MKRFVDFLTVLALKRPRLTVTVALLLSLAGLLHASRALEFDTNQDNLISPEAAYFQDYKRFLEEFGDWEYIYAVIRADGDREKAKRLAATLAEKLRERPDLFGEVTEKIDADALKNGGLLLLPEKDFADFASGLRPFAAETGAFLKLRTSADFYAWISALLERPGPGFDRDALEKFWDVFEAGVRAPFERESLAGFDVARLISGATGRYLDRDGYLFSGDGKLLFVQILPRKNYSEMQIVREPLSYLREQVAALHVEFPDVEFGVTGRPVLQDDEAVSTGNDSQWASLGSLVLVTALFLFFVKDLRLSLFSLAALGAGIATTTGLVSLVLGSVNLLTIVFAVILIGMGMDYGIHFMLHYQLLKGRAASPREAVARALGENGEAILLGAGMTALGFGTALFTDFKGLQELGFIVASGIAICCLLQLTLFPALIALLDGPSRRDGEDLLSRFAPLVRLAERCLKRPRVTLAVSTALALAALPLMAGVVFDYNLLKLQDPELESVRYEKLIESESDESTWFLSAMTSDKKQLARWRDEVAKLPSVGRADSMLDLVPENPEARIAALGKLRRNMDKNSSYREAAWFSETQRLSENLARLSRAAFSSGDAEAFASLDGLARAAADFAVSFNERSPFFTPPFETEFRERLAEIQKTFAALLAPKIPTETDIPPQILKRYLSPNGRYSLAIHPKGDVWDWRTLETFIAEVRSVIPGVTGAPVTTYESALRMNGGFRDIGLLTSAAVLVLLVLAFREIRTPLVIAMSLALTFVYLFAFMRLAGVSLNLANFFALPILIGSNVDHGIYLFHHFREHRSLPKLFQLTVPPVFLSCLTNVVGFATLALVRHRGLAGFGLIMAAGTFLSLAVTAVWIPCVIRVFYEKNSD